MILSYPKRVTFFTLGVNMTEVKTFKIGQRFNGKEGLYRYLFENVKSLEEMTNLKIQNPLKARMHCVVGQEKITERNILFFASKSEFTQNLGELITLASVFEADIIIFFVNNANQNYLLCLNWLNRICNEDTQFIVGETSF